MTDRGQPSFTVCVCTRNRPDDLAACLRSIDQSDFAVERVVVSDDSDDGAANAQVCASFARVNYVAGPRRGLCANRNNALKHVSTPYVLFLDDDARLSTRFFSRIAERIEQVEPAKQRRLIITGRERRNDQRLTESHEQSFLGFQQRDYDRGERLSTVVINATVFPTELFSLLGFDESLRYGYDEVDLTTRAVAAGYEIESLPDAINDHYPADANRDEYRAVVDASRLYVTYRRYASTERRRGAAIAYLAVAPLHLAASQVKRNGLTGLSKTLATLRLALRHLRAGGGGASAPAPLKPR